MLVAIVTAPGRPAWAMIDRLALVLLGVEHLVGDAPSFEHPRELLRRLDGDRAHQHRLARLAGRHDFVHHLIELRVLRLA